MLEVKNNYPRVFEERSRDLKMYILYFLILGMYPIKDWSTFIAEVDSKSIKPVPAEIRAFSHPDNTILSEKDIRSKIASLFGK